MFSSADGSAVALRDPDVELTRTNTVPSRSRGLTFAVTLVALGAPAIRLVHLDTESLWIDELATVQTYYLDPAGVVRAAAIAGQPPLDNFIGAALARIGFAESDWWVRFPAVVFGAGGVFLLGWWVARFAGAFAGVTAAVLLAICPLHVAMSQEARPYALSFFLLLASIMTYVRARERNTNAAWGVFSSVVFLMLMSRWTDPHFVVFGIAVYSAAVWLRGRGDRQEKTPETKKLLRTAAALCVAYAAYAPFFWVVLSHSGRAIGAGSTSWGDRFWKMLSQSFAALFSGYSTRTVFSALPGAAWVIALGGALAMIGTGILLVRARRYEGCGLFLCVLLPFPFLYAAVYACLGNAVPKPQYLLPMAAPVCAGIGVSLQALYELTAKRRRAIGIVAFVLPALAVALPMARATFEGLQRIDKRDWRGVMGYLRAHARPGDVAATAASDTVPPTFSPIAYGKNRYGAEYLKFVPIALSTTLDAFDPDAWRDRENTVWLLVYTDRMYLGYDQVPPPSRVGNAHATTMAVHAFNGLFLVEVHGDQPGVDRLMDGIAALYEDLPDGRSLIAPAVLRSRWLMSRGDTLGAKAALDIAFRQCRSQNEALILRRAVFASTPPLPASLALTP